MTTNQPVRTRNLERIDVLTRLRSLQERDARAKATGAAQEASRLKKARDEAVAALDNLAALDNMATEMESSEDFHRQISLEEAYARRARLAELAWLEATRRQERLQAAWIEAAKRLRSMEMLQERTERELARWRLAREARLLDEVTQRNFVIRSQT
jgi:flagellar biosynthesis chaperone FliJ